MAKYQLSRTQLDWIVMALNHDIGEVKREMENSSDGSPIQSIGELFIEGRQNVIRILSDVIHSKAKTIEIK